MKKKLSKRLAILLLLLIAVAVGGAYVLSSVNSGQGALAAAAYSAVGMTTYMPLGYEDKQYGVNNSIFGSGLYGNTNTQFGDVPLPKKDPSKCDPWDLLCKGEKAKEKVDQRNMLDENATNCISGLGGGDGYILFEVKDGKLVNPSCNTGKPPAKKKN